jgi:cytochrome c oxidase subunit III
MAIATSAKEELDKLTDSGGNGDDFNNRNGGDGGGDGNDKRGPEPPDPYRIFAWLGMVPISIMFISIAVALVVLRFHPNAFKHWVGLKLPATLWLSTTAIFASSITIELARRALKNGSAFNFKRWWSVTLVLATIFVFSQFYSWLNLVSQGIYFASTFNSSFFYTFTGLHATHVLGGMIALVYISLGARGNRYTFSRLSRVEATALYWHLMDGLWLGLFLLFFVLR